jgi:hypothetical protein
MARSGVIDLDVAESYAENPLGSGEPAMPTIPPFDEVDCWPTEKRASWAERLSRS